MGVDVVGPSATGGVATMSTVPAPPPGQTGPHGPSVPAPRLSAPAASTGRVRLPARIGFRTGPHRSAQVVAVLHRKQSIRAPE